MKLSAPYALAFKHFLDDIAKERPGPHTGPRLRRIEDVWRTSPLLPPNARRALAVAGLDALDTPDAVAFAAIQRKAWRPQVFTTWEQVVAVTKPMHLLTPDRLIIGDPSIEVCNLAEHYNPSADTTWVTVAEVDLDHLDDPDTVTDAVRRAIARHAKALPTVEVDVETHVVRATVPELAHIAPADLLARLSEVCHASTGSAWREPHPTPERIPA